MAWPCPWLVGARSQGDLTSLVGDTTYKASTDNKGRFKRLFNLNVLRRLGRQDNRTEGSDSVDSSTVLRETGTPVECRLKINNTQ